MTIFDKQIHKDEFKLRMLLTNSCNKNCVFCLNDFQPKPEPALFLDSGLALCAISAYTYSRRQQEPLQIYFSGGEPTLHRDLPYLINAAKAGHARVTLNTNGTYPKSFTPCLHLVDCMHFGIYEKDALLAEEIRRRNGSLQCVYSSKDPYVTEEFLQFYMRYNIPIKIFGDLKEDPASYELFANYIKQQHPEYPFSFRFIGKQENRGAGCNNCDRYCVTLKGAWVFPDGGVSHCPQRCKGKVYYPGPHISEWKHALMLIREMHKICIVE